MAWRPHGHARVNPNNPSAFGVCDLCGFLFNLSDLTFQFDWRGSQLTNTQLRVCRKDLDKPFNFYRPIILPADPVPVANPRPEDYEAEDNDDRPTPAPYD